MSDAPPHPAPLKIDAEVVRGCPIPVPTPLLFEQIAKSLNFTDCENQTLLATGETWNTLWDCMDDASKEDFIRLAKAAYAVVVQFGYPRFKVVKEPA